MSIINDHINAGIAMLDEVRPGWRASINTDDLDLATVDRCVLGQVFGDYAVGLSAICSKHPYLTQAEVRYCYGFSSNDEDYDYDDLTREWRRILSAPTGSDEEAVFALFKSTADRVDLFIALTGSTAPRYLLEAALG